MAEFNTWSSEVRLRSRAWGDEIARRAALAREPRPQGVSGPRAHLLWGELASFGMVARRLPRIHPAERPQPVMLLPGFGSHPLRMARMGSALGLAGHKVRDWGMGFNLGPTPENFAFLIERIEAQAQETGAPVALVGWSLGGLFAREAAKQLPHKVSSVITLGTPFSGDRHANNAWRAYQFITGHSVDAPPIGSDSASKPPVPTVALWSPRDGVVSPRSACGRPGERDRAVAMRCAHMGFANDPSVISEVLRQLDRKD